MDSSFSLFNIVRPCGLGHPGEHFFLRALRLESHDRVDSRLRRRLVLVLDDSIAGLLKNLPYFLIRLEFMHVDAFECVARFLSGRGVEILVIVLFEALASVATEVKVLIPLLLAELPADVHRVVREVLFFVADHRKQL